MTLLGLTAGDDSPPARIARGPTDGVSHPWSPAFVDIAGREHRPADDPAANATVLVFILADCPIANSYIPEINRLDEAFSIRGVKIFLVHVDPDMTADQAREHARQYRIRPPVVLDPQHLWVKRAAATVSPEAVVFSAAGQIVYRGRIDDRYAGLGKRRAIVTSRDLHDALQAVIAGKSVPTPRTEAIGCPIPDLPQKGSPMKTKALAPALMIALFACSTLAAADTTPSEPITFSTHIAPLVFEHCAGCHRPGEVAPFPLLSYADVQKRARQIAQVTADRYMPPWKSVEGHGRFFGERRLTSDQIRLISRWVAQGAPEGDPQHMPPPPKFPDGWTLGQPDIVVTMPEPYAIPADGPDIYRNFVLPLSIPPGKYIKALEYRPSNRRIVHHALFAVDTTDKSRKEDQADPLPGFKGSLNIPGRLFPGSLSAWAPGREAIPLAEGLSMPWKNGSDLILQLHLHPSGKPEEEQSSIGLFLTDQPPQRSMVDVMMLDRKIDIPPGERAYRTRDEFTVPIEMEVLGIFPHMHLLGRDIKLTAHPPGGQPFSLLWINDWDFNWQSIYQCDPPVRLAAGTKIVLEGIHDNSADNFRNPNSPPRRVTFGEQTADEMTAALLQLVPVRENDLDKMKKANQKRIVSGISAGG